MLPAVAGAATRARVRVDGKHFAVGGDRFRFSGVTYGTFRPRPSDGARVPDPARLADDLDAIADAGFTVVRTYTLPPDDLLEGAAARGLKVLAGIFWPDWRYMLGSSRREVRRIAATAREEVREAATRLRGCDTVLGVCLGNEIPADVIRWVGTPTIARTIDDLGNVVRDIDPDVLVTYGNYPTAEYLPLEGMDFLTFNVFLERQPDLRRYLTRLHHLAGDRPLVLGETGLDSGGTPEGEAVQAETLSWQLETALERGVAGTCVFSWTDEWWVGDAAVEGWHFGLTRADRSPKPALDVAASWNGRVVGDLHAEWPSMSVVICAYNAEATIAECLEHTCRLDYPDLDIVVVDDGSTDATATIAERFPVRLLRLPHAGLSVARNEGMKAARGDIVTYLDSDAYPTAEWPYYLALAFDSATVGGVGGPNVPPRDDPPSAQRVARAPGGPVHVLVADDRAEHVPGCNMAFWKNVLAEVGGFDPIYTAAGDDVDLCWKVLDRGWEIGFHPAALVWHHRRAGTRAYLRQQRGYGKAEALVEARHPDRFTVTGSARWRGRIYDSFAPRLGTQRVYRGEFGTAAFQSVYRGGGHLRDLVHQVGVPAAVLGSLTAPMAAVDAELGIVGIAALVFLLAMFVSDVMQAVPPSGEQSPWRFRVGVAMLHFLQPVVRLWGRTRHRATARVGLVAVPAIPGPAVEVRGGIAVPVTNTRAHLAAQLVSLLRVRGFRVVPSSGWDTFDARVLGSTLIDASLITSEHPVGWIQMRVRRHLRGRPAVVALVVSALAAIALSPGAGAAVLVAAGASALRGAVRTRSLLRHLRSAICDIEAPTEVQVIDLTAAEAIEIDLRDGALAESRSAAGS